MSANIACQLIVDYESFTWIIMEKKSARFIGMSVKDYTLLRFSNNIY